MSEGLPGCVDVARLAARGAAMSNVTPVSSMSRLVGLLAEDTGVVTSKLSFAHDGHGRVVVEGRIKAAPVMTCQRCLDSVSVAVVADVHLAVVDADSGESDQVVADDGRLSLLELVEDELILALPIVAMHDEGTCQSAVETADIGLGGETRVNPFAVLQKLKE